MIKQFLFILFSLLLFSACSSEKQREIRIATNSWVGYSPLFYAKETGELDKLGIKLITNVSLAEASEIFEVGKADLVTTTQYEYLTLKEVIQDVVPVILIDRSNGGDMILSNKTIDEINNAETIYAYLEIDSINSELLKSFIQTHHLENKQLIYTNKDQLQISDLENNEKNAMVVVTYAPYNTELEKRGFEEVASTKDINSLVVIDALCTKKAIYNSDKARLQQLKVQIDRAILEIEQNPQKAHKLIGKYLGNISYDEYVDAVKSIKWINKNPSQELLKKINKLGYEETILIQ
ncbi:hypothetical protein [Sulfurimonas marina]|uniref:SsuA/THI5-like domain-containing protein n=1 Tax=Sulfurimonas marina TaxID=2590551 RepID=A0A7M1AYQ1_9BACT|nr:hypothetical protein [Sulfurimonas marina]QOP41512.1 hypothetical protein FJR03_07045 [Sulfurimonas marina]